jgi:hypothetical protein
MAFGLTIPKAQIRLTRTVVDCLSHNFDDHMETSIRDKVLSDLWAFLHTALTDRLAYSTEDTLNRNFGRGHNDIKA